MKIPFLPALLLLGSLAFLNLTAAEQALSLDPQLEPLRPWLGKTWKGELKDAKTGKTNEDVSRWERALNGRAVRILHSVDAGAYGGETIVRWDKKQNAVVYHYFTTAAFTTNGTMTFQDGAIQTLEKVAGEAEGVSEVRGTLKIGSDGTFQMKTDYLKDGKWQPARETTYREDATAQVIFK